MVPSALALGLVLGVQPRKECSTGPRGLVLRCSASWAAPKKQAELVEQNQLTLPCETQSMRVCSFLQPILKGPLVAQRGSGTKSMERLAMLTSFRYNANHHWNDGENSHPSLMSKGSEQNKQSRKILESKQGNCSVSTHIATKRNSASSQSALPQRCLGFSGCVDTLVPPIADALLRSKPCHGGQDMREAPWKTRIFV